MSMVAANFQRLIEEQEVKKKRKQRKHAKLKKIRVEKYNEKRGYREDTDVYTPDYGTFEEMFEKYKNDYKYYCAMMPVGFFELFPDKEVAKEELEKYPIKYIAETQAPPDFPSQDARESALEHNTHLNPLKFYGEHITWIDLEHNCILVEKAW